MKFAAVLFILSVHYIASTEQAPAPDGVHTYPSRSWKEMGRKAEQGMEEFKTNLEEFQKTPMWKPEPFSQNAKAAEVTEELLQCANMDCTGEIS